MTCTRKSLPLSLLLPPSSWKLTLCGLLTGGAGRAVSQSFVALLECVVGFERLGVFNPGSLWAQMGPPVSSI